MVISLLRPAPLAQRHHVACSLQLRDNGMSQNSKQILQSLKCVSSCVYLQETYVVMEWCEKGSLQSAVADGVFHVHGSEWGHDAIMPIIGATLLDIATGMAYLHRMHILHCDLKLRNVLLKLAQVQLPYCSQWL